jgi:sulfite reductase (ferredoxin)
MPPRGRGQWALGYREPLNPNERTKRDDDGLNVRERILTRYAREGFEAIPKDDLRGRFRWWGLYTQRRQGARGEVEEIEDHHFMLRIRIPGGQLSSRQLRVVGELSERYGRDVADVTDRQNVQLHWVRIEDVPAIWEALEAVGLSTAEACGDTPRAMLGCPLAGIAADEVIDATPWLMETNRRYVGDPAFSNLPRKFKTSISGCAHQCAEHEINDVAFVGARDAEGRPGFDLWVGGGLGPVPRFAQRLGVFVEPDRVPDVWAGVISTFRDYGYRRSRTQARLKFLIGDWGPERFREVLEREYLGYALPVGAAPPAATGAQRDHLGVHPQADGMLYVGFAPRAGRTTGTQLQRVAELAELHGAGRVRATTQQKLVILDVRPDRVDELVDALAEHDLQVHASAFRQGTMACTGIEFCKLAVVDTKTRADWLYRELERRLPDFDERLRINVNGCPNSCARVQVADIGLLGSLITVGDGEKVEGFQVHLGGHLGEDHRVGRRVKGVRVPADELADYVELLLRRFEETREEGEPFHRWAERAEESWLAHDVRVPAGAGAA